MLNIIENNPYRLLGVYSNSSTKEKVANTNRLKAFLKVGKQEKFPLDLPQFLSPIERTTECIENALAKLTLPNDQFKYARFWFIKSTSIDDVAFNHLLVGNMEMAISIWGKKDDLSSLQNRIVCALISNDFSTALSCAEKLYSQYSDKFAEAILGKNHTISTENLEQEFIDILLSELDVNKILPNISNSKWKEYVTDKAAEPLIALLESSISESSLSKGKDSNDSYKAGTKLMKDTKSTLLQLKSILSTSNLKYQMIADKLGLEILQCGINYFNGSNENNRTQKAMILQNYALSIVVGSVAKQRCQENVDILKKILSELPPIEVMSQYNSIMAELSRYSKLPNKINTAITLLNNTKQDLVSIKTKLGSTHSAYLKLSSTIINAALYNIIEEVNAVQERGLYQDVKSVLKNAWSATLMMDKFDMEYEFKKNRYDVNRSILKNLCEEFGVGTSIASSNISLPKKHMGCGVALVLWIISGCILGAIFSATGGDFSVGFIITGLIMLVVRRLSNL